MALSDILQRLRPAGAPGAAGPVAVPAQDDERALAELAPVFDALAPVIAQSDAIRAAARESAAAETVDAQREANAVIADARSRAPAERAAAAAKIHRSGDAKAKALIDGAHADADALRAARRDQLDELTERVIGNLRDRITRMGDGSGRTRDHGLSEGGVDR